MTLHLQAKTFPRGKNAREDIFKFPLNFFVNYLYKYVIFDKKVHDNRN